MIIFDDLTTDLIIPNNIGNNRGYENGYEDGYGVGVKEGYEKGHIDGETEGYTQGKAEGIVEGVTEQKSKLEEATFTVNGTYEKEDGWNKVTVETAGVTSIDVGAEGLKFVDATFTHISDFYDFTNVNGSAGYMFNNCTNLLELPLDLFGDSKPTNTRYMFNGCQKLKGTVKINLSESTDCTYMFNNCPYVEEIDIMGDKMVATTFQYLFNNCQRLKTITLLDFSGFGSKTYAWHSTELNYTFNGLGSALPDRSVDITFSNIGFTKEPYSSGYNPWEGNVNKWSDYTIQSWVDALVDYSGKTQHKATISSNFNNRLTEEQMATIIAKNWIIAVK